MVHGGRIEKIIQGSGDIAAAQSYLNVHASQIPEAQRDILAGLIEMAQLDQEREMRQAEERTRLQEQVEAEDIAEEVKKAVELMDGGAMVDIDTIIARAAGSGHEAELDAAMERAGEMNRFALLPPAAQAAQLRLFVGRDDLTPDDLHKFQVMEKAHRLAKKAIADDPLIHAGKIGLVAGVTPMPAMNGQEFGPWLTERVARAKQVQAHYGTPVSPFTGDEAALVVENLNQGDGKMKIAFLDAVTKAAGPLAGEVMRGLGQKCGGVLAFAGELLANGAPHVAKNIIRGQDLRREHKGIVPVEVEWKRDMEDHFHGVLDHMPWLRSAAREAVLALYAAKSAAVGDFSGALDSERMRESLEQALPVIEIERDLNDVQEADRIIPPKYDMDSGDVLEWLYGLQESDMEIQGADPAMLPIIKDKGRLITIDRGRYMVRLDDELIVTASGEPLVLEYRKVEL